jgi:hypothetical protein
MTDDGLPDFSGKVVFVQLPAEGYHWTLVEARFERQGGCWVLVGKPFHVGDDHWTRGSTIGIRWKYVAYYAGFDSIEEVRARQQTKPTTSDITKGPRRGWLGRRRVA